MYNGSTDANNCIHCHICQNSCAFLSKYGLDIGDTDRLKRLAFHCFLCGKCTEVCPVKIDGRQVILDMRRSRVSEGEKQSVERSHKGLISEKRDYIYRNWKGVTAGAVFFPGCNFPSMYPKTNAKISKIFKEHGIGTVYECCGKPIAELGLYEDEKRILSEIKQKLDSNGVEEIITACPNCREFFGDRLGVKVTSVYSKFAELGIGNAVEDDFTFFIPCPDRGRKQWIEEIKPFINGRIKCIEDVQCCGLGGNAASFEPEIAETFTVKLKELTSSGDGSGKTGSATLADQHIVTYCASCTGKFRRSGFDSIDHILTKIIGTDEKPDTRKSYLNRVMTKFK